MLQLLILLLTLLVTLNAKCPSMCICKHYPSAIKCSEGFRGNWTLNNNTKVLDVSQIDDLTDLMESIVNSNLFELDYVKLTNSFVSNVSEVFDLVGDKVKYLTLSNDNISVIPSVNDRFIVSLLDLSCNVLEEIPPILSRTLEGLNLSSNYIRTISSNSFNNFTKLKQLDLSQNLLNTLQGLELLVDLQYLNLSRNRLEVLQDNCFSNLVKLQQLDVSWNNLVRVAPGSLQLPSLTRLLLEGNSRLGNTQSVELIVEVGKKLHTVDASKLGLQKVPTTLTQSIRTLRLAKNFIKLIICGELDAYPLLQLLDFTSNRIVTIEEDALGRQESLSILYLTDNKLKSIPKSLPEKLTVLHLECNKIVKISRDDFSGLSNLEVLLLNDNKIDNVEGDAFTFLDSLVTLDLSRNLIKALDPGSLSGPIALQILRLSGLDLVPLPEDTLFPLSTPDHLVSLDLSGSGGLVRQFLSDVAALAASRELQELDISGADVEFIRSDLLHYLPELRIIHVKDNRLNCTNLQWLAGWLRRQDHAENRLVTCASPPEFWGIPLLDLQVNESPLRKEINHENGGDFKGTINLGAAAAALQNKGHSRKYDQQSMGLAIITNNLEKNPSSTRTSLNKSETSIEPKTKTNENVNSSYANNEQVSKTEYVDIVKNVNKILVSSAPLKLLSLIPQSNEREKEFLTRPTTLKTTSSTSSFEDNPSEQKITHRSNSFAQPPLDSDNNNEYSAAPNSDIVQTTLNSMLSNESTFKGRFGLVETNQTELINNDDNDISHWNSSDIKTSMYRNENNRLLLHPGMLVLFLCLLSGAAILIILALRFNHKRTQFLNNRENNCADNENGIASVTELW